MGIDISIFLFNNQKFESARCICDEILKIEKNLKAETMLSDIHSFQGNYVEAIFHLQRALGLMKKAKLGKTTLSFFRAKLRILEKSERDEILPRQWKKLFSQKEETQSNRPDLSEEIEKSIHNLRCHWESTFFE